MKTISFTALHYGKTYLGYALRSVIAHVDEAWILYSPVGSHGFRADVPCPETRDELYAIAQQVAGDKLRWVDGEWPHEGAQRDAIFQHVPDADIVIVADSDEIWREDLLTHLRHVFIPQALADTAQARFVRFRMIHYWRSFWRAVTDDNAMPVRLIFPQQPAGECYWPKDMGLINHLGYAQPEEITRYKQLTHGHRNEWRADWFETKFLTNAQVDVHPTNEDYWHVVAVNPMDYLPTWMVEHPFFCKDVIA